MAVTLPRIIGRDGVLTCDGIKTKWQTASVTITRNTENATASDSEDDEVVRTTRLLSGTITGYLGAANNGATLPVEGDAITDFDFIVETDESVFPDIADYTNVKVTNVKYDLVLGPATFSFDFRSGVLN
ncbi:hypothetical protein EON80_32595 [bacterium]|nr:MAG: hypothetical protein EON80_32595 [bacterium]